MGSVIPGNPFSADGVWYRGSPHNHTTASDGGHSVVEIAQWYEARDMDFIFITDHNVVADVDETKGQGILVMPGAEVGLLWDEALGAELLCLGIDEIKRKGVHPQDAIYDTLEQGGLPYISHPYLSGVYSALMMNLDGLVGLEVYNAAADAVWGRGVTSVHLDDLMATGKIIWGLASDDLHSLREPSSRIEVRAAERTREGILSAMRDGLYYSTTGPAIHDIAVTETEVTVRCSGAKRVIFSSLPWLSRKVEASNGDLLTRASAELEALGSSRRLESFMEDLLTKGLVSASRKIVPHVRIEVHDEFGGVAWSNPIPLP